jgi:hypothetical protein
MTTHLLAQAAQDNTGFTPANVRSQLSGIIGLHGGANANLTTPGGILSALLRYLFVFAGLILLVMLIWGGFEILMGAAEPKSQEAGKQRITAALLGFLLLFASIWIAQIAEIIFGINILHN